MNDARHPAKLCGGRSPRAVRVVGWLAGAVFGVLGCASADDDDDRPSASSAAVTGGATIGSGSGLTTSATGGTAATASSGGTSASTGTATTAGTATTGSSGTAPSSSSGGSTGGKTTTTGYMPPDTTPRSGDVPSIPYCSSVDAWPAYQVEREETLLAEINAVRATGYACADGTMPPAGPLVFDKALRCAARVHSIDMQDRDYFDHSSPEGEGPGGRAQKAGYSGGVGENIALEVGVMPWLKSPAGHCTNLMKGEWRRVGIGITGPQVAVFGP